VLVTIHDIKQDTTKETKEIDYKATVNSAIGLASLSVLSEPVGRGEVQRISSKNLRRSFTSDR
jgi:hypothetical protein